MNILAMQEMYLTDYECIFVGKMCPKPFKYISRSVKLVILIYIYL